MARESMWGSRTLTIEELLGLPEVERATTDEHRTRVKALAGLTKADQVDSATVASDMPEDVKVATLYSHEDFVSLFDHINDLTRVTRVVVSAYFGLGTKAVEAGLAKHFPDNKTDGTWRRQLSNWPKKNPPPAALLNRGYRWSFVRDEMPGMLSNQIARAKDKQLRLMESAQGPRIPKRLPTLFAGPLKDGIQYLVDRHGKVICKLGQGHVSAAEFIGYCDDGARLQWMTPIEALRRPWLDLVARAAWEGPVRRAVAIAVQDMEDDFRVALTESESLRFERTFEPADDLGPSVRPPGIHL